MAAGKVPALSNSAHLSARDTESRHQEHQPRNSFALMRRLGEVSTGDQPHFRRHTLPRYHTPFVITPSPVILNLFQDLTTALPIN
jgi:hypothetical protein